VKRSNSALQSWKDFMDKWKSCWSWKDKRNMMKRLLEIYRPSTHHVFVNILTFLDSVDIV